MRPDGEVHKHKSQILHCREKLLSREAVPVLKTDTGGQSEKLKADRITLAKELCKIAP